MEHGRDVRQEPQSFSIPTPLVERVQGSLYHNGGTCCSRNGMMDYQRFPISKMLFGKFPASLKFQNFKTEVGAKLAFPCVTLHWIEEVEVAKSIDDPMKSQSITGQTKFTDCEMLDVKIASALKRLLNTHMHFRKRVSVEKQRAQKDDRFSRGRKKVRLYQPHVY